MKKQMRFVYPAIFVQGEDDIMMQVIFPDLNIYTDGIDMTEAFLNARDLLKTYFSYIMKYDTDFNMPTKVEDLVKKCKPNEIVMFVDAVVDLAEL